MRVERPKPAPDPERDLQRVADGAEKLLQEVERLRRDVTRLAGRITPFEGEPKIPDPPPYARAKVPRDATFQYAVGQINVAREAIVGCEHHLSAIRGKIDAIESDAIPRNEMKEWIKR